MTRAVGHGLPVAFLVAVLLLVSPGVASSDGRADGVLGAQLSHATAAVSPSNGCGHSPNRAALSLPAANPRPFASGSVHSSYLLSLPRHYRAHHPYHLVLLFYGFASNPAQFSELTNLPIRGAAGGDIVVVPHTTGTESEWQFSGSGSDAVLIEALVGSLEQSYCVDRHAVFATGFSAGAAFTIIYACSHPGQIAAIATVAVDFQLGCTRPLPILAFHGTADPEVPYQNAAVGLSLPGVKVRGTQLNMGDWARLDHCAASPRTERIGSQVREQRWTGCTKGTSVTLFSIAGGGHTWPGADPHKGFGLTTQQVNATTQILRFFGTGGRRI
jgi:polyhydroxybutyrate depolymerase